MYCGKAVNFASDLRKHINHSKVYAEKNLRAFCGAPGKNQTVTPGWTRRDNTETIPSRRSTRRTRTGTLTDNTTAAPPS